MHWLLGFLLCSFAAVSMAETQQTPPPLHTDRLLDKLSVQLRGRTASPEEKKAFKSAIVEAPENFESIYSQQIDRMMQDPGYAKSIARLHSVWWRIPFGSVAHHAGEIVAQNRSYKEIFQRDYIYVDAQQAQSYRSLGVQTSADLPLDSRAPVYVPLAPEEQRFRGLFSSLEFLTAYPDTETNVNRKRSSQVFRIAFCETLQNLSLERRHEEFRSEDPHGSQPDCVGCHRRLDPMARFFDQWGPPIVGAALPVYDAFQASEGTVYLGGALGMNRAFPGVADKDLGAIVIAQPEFASCLARLSWQYAFGTSVAPPADLIDQLASQYKQSERMSPMIKTVLQHPYFWSQAEAPPLRYDDVKGLLKNCGSCHAQARGTRFDPNSYPFLPEPEANAALLARIWQAINHGPGVRPMPEAPQPRLPVESIEMLRNWISRGAEATAGQPSLNDEQVEAILE